MGQVLAAIRLIGGPIPLIVWGLSAVVFALLIVRAKRRPALWRWIGEVSVAVLVGGGLGFGLCWLFGDVFNLWDVTLTLTTRLWVAASLAAILVAILNLRRARTLRRVVAVGGMVLFVLAGALGVNADFGQYTTLASVFDIGSFSDASATALGIQKSNASEGQAEATELWTTWRAPKDMPKRGTVSTVTIPATVSHFAARKALIYLPPAALVPNPPALPVLIMLSGQPGSPENVFLSGHLDAVMDGFAQANNGLAPIVVVPDQLSAPQVNPMCVDSAIGNSATYLTVDVPTWIRANLTVQHSATSWGIGGFSQGGTCAIQLGGAHPELFGSIVDVSGELEPKVGSPEATIAAGFAGNAAAYEAAKPLSIINSHKPFRNTVAVFGVGALDSKYQPWVSTVSSAAADAGMRVTVFSAPGTAHDWYTATYTFQHGLPKIFAQMGLTRPAS